MVTWYTTTSKSSPWLGTVEATDSTELSVTGPELDDPSGKKKDKLSIKQRWVERDDKQNSHN